MQTERIMKSPINYSDKFSVNNQVKTHLDKNKYIKQGVEKNADFKSRYEEITKSI